MPTLTEIAAKLKRQSEGNLKKTVSDFDNKKNLGEALRLINQRLVKLAEKGAFLTISEESEI
jgi:phosphopantothenate synthetase